MYSSDTQDLPVLITRSSSASTDGLSRRVARLRHRLRLILKSKHIRKYDRVRHANARRDDIMIRPVLRASELRRDERRRERAEPVRRVQEAELHRHVLAQPADVPVRLRVLEGDAVAREEEAEAHDGEGPRGGEDPVCD